MTSFLIKKLKKGGNVGERSAVMSGVSGIVCNLILCTTKFIIGILSGSVAVTTDGFNNFSDAATNIVTIMGAKLSRKPVDKEHPFGHGRLEYIAALIVAFSIFDVSVELLKESISKIVSPEPLKFSLVYVLVLAFAICVKLWMALLNHRLYKLSGSVALKAVRQDSINDCVATSATILALVLFRLLGIAWLDGVIGALVAVFVFISGIGILRDILNPLLGQAPPRETTCKIEELILNNDKILGVHDIIVHNYGVNRVIASAHAEVPSSLDLMTAHKLVDGIERTIKKELGISITIHVDPVSVHDAERIKYADAVKRILQEYNSSLSFHDLHITDTEPKPTLSVDVLIPFEEKDCDKIQADLNALLGESCPEVLPDVTVEYPLT